MAPGVILGVYLFSVSMATGAAFIACVLALVAPQVLRAVRAGLASSFVFAMTAVAALMVMGGVGSVFVRLCGHSEGAICYLSRFDMSLSLLLGGLVQLVLLMAVTVACLWHEGRWRRERNRAAPLGKPSTDTPISSLLLLANTLLAVCCVIHTALLVAVIGGLGPLCAVPLVPLLLLFSFVLGTAFLLLVTCLLHPQEVRGLGDLRCVGYWLLTVASLLAMGLAGLLVAENDERAAVLAAVVEGGEAPVFWLAIVLVGYVVLIVTQSVVVVTSRHHARFDSHATGWLATSIPASLGNKMAGLGQEGGVLVPGRKRLVSQSRVADADSLLVCAEIVANATVLIGALVYTHLMVSLLLANY
ncbi:MAG: hypothetical protein LBD25_01035 [Coriobacteriales bacterium]|jgi:hypothetical protein|nr:hypothetical protein [Coriobacteriales bacterium]